MQSHANRRPLSTSSIRWPGWIVSIGLLGLLAACGEGHEPIDGIGPTGPVRKLGGEHLFTEGPAVDAEGRIYFSDLKEERIHRLDPDGRETPFVPESRRANGLMVDASRARLLACESGVGGEIGLARIVAYDLDSGEREVVVSGYEGRPFNRVNDLVLDREGGVYFTDIVSGGDGHPQETSGVYYAATDGAVRRLLDDLDRPNGVILSPDESSLYVVPYGSGTVMRYPVLAPGTLGEGGVLVELPGLESMPGRGGDGVAVDEDGNLYVAVPGLTALVVVAPTGDLLGRIPLPEAPSNAVFGGDDLRTLYVTAGGSVYAVPMQVRGHTFGLGN